MSKTDNQKKYRVLINGQNFLLSSEGKTRKAGFHTTRFVEAQDDDEAEIVAISSIKSDARLTEIVQNKPGDSPTLYVEEIEEVKELGAQTGYAFYDEEEAAHGNKEEAAH